MKTRVADPTLRREVEAAVRRRVRGDEAEDVVQATLADVLSAHTVPEEPEEFRRFVFGVARNKVFDHFRRQKRQTAGLDESETAAPEPPLSARDILRWAEGELPDSESQSTLEWMLREGDGEKLEHIARDARVPATRVRKRVSRLRKFLRDRWAAELLLIGVLLLLGGLGALYWFASGRTPDDFVKREPVRPLPSAPREAPPPSRPAGNPAPLPNLVAPPRPEPAPSALPSAMPSALPAKQLKAPPISTEDGRSFPAPVIVGKQAKPTPAPQAQSQVNSLDGLGSVGTDVKSNAAPTKRKAALDTKAQTPGKPGVTPDLDLDFDSRLGGSKK
jgi:RNA polymerase sigma factor (sigma-70 family)